MPTDRVIEPERALANVSTFLSSHGTDLPSVIAAVDSAIGLGPEDQLFAVGSVVEGLGNRKSDLDLLLVVPDAATSGAGDEVTLLVDRCLVEVRFLRSGQVRALLDRFEAWCQRPWNVTHAAGFSLAERSLLHRLHHCLVLQGSDWRLPEVELSTANLARLKLHDARQTSRTIQVDLVGYRESHDYRSLVYASQDLLGLAVDALAACYGLTNPVRKWRNRLLDLVPAAWEESFNVRPSGLPAGDRVWRLHLGPESPDREDAVRHALAVTAFARAVFAGAERALLAGSTDAASERMDWRRARAACKSSVLPCLDFDVDFMPIGPGQVAIARLNEFGHPLELPSPDFAPVLLFDGVTTMSEAQAALYGDPGDDDRDDVRRVVSKVVDAGLTLPWPQG